MIGSTNPRLGGRCENAGIFGKLKVFLAALPKAVTGAEVGERRFRTLLLIVPWLVLAASPDRGSGQNNPGDFFTGFTATADGETTVTLSWSFTQLAVSGTMNLRLPGSPPARKILADYGLGLKGQQSFADTGLPWRRESVGIRPDRRLTGTRYPTRPKAATRGVSDATATIIRPPINLNEGSFPQSEGVVK